MKLRFILPLIFLFSPLYAIGYNVNFALDAGITECLGGNQIEQNLNVWDDVSNIGKYINYGGLLSADILFLKTQDIEVGLELKRVKLNYLTKEGNIYSNEATSVEFSVLKIPVLYKLSFPLSKTNNLVNSVDIGVGLCFSFIFGDQVYKDEITKDAGNFLYEPYNFGISFKATYTQKIGPGFAFIGLYGDFNFLPYKYATQNNITDIGRTLSISPTIGYTFKIKEDIYQSKITEKNKRIKDIDVR